MNAKIFVDQRELEYLMSLPEKVIERYSSAQYVRDYLAKKVKVPPLPMVEYGPNTKRFHLRDCEDWVKKNFSILREEEAA